MQTRTHHVAVLAGDGIGPEVMAEALKVMDAAAKKFGFTVTRDERLVGGAAHRRLRQAAARRNRRGLRQGRRHSVRLRGRPEVGRALPHESRPEVGALLP